MSNLICYKNKNNLTSVKFSTKFKTKLNTTRSAKQANIPKETTATFLLFQGRFPWRGHIPERSATSHGCLLCLHPDFRNKEWFCALRGDSYRISIPPQKAHMWQQQQQQSNRWILLSFFFAFCIFRPTLGTLTDRSKRKIAFTAENSVGKSWNINRLVIVETTGWAFPLCNFCGLIFLLTNFLHRKQFFPMESIKLRFPLKFV